MKKLVSHPSSLKARAPGGRYYLLCTGKDGIYCRDTSIVGSIGVVSGGFGFVDAIKKLGVERRVYTSGKSKVQLDPFLPEKEEDLALRQRLLNDIHRSFKAVVVDARGDKLKIEEDRAFSGEVFTGREAVEHGLCDAVGDLRGVMRRKFGDAVKFRHFGGPRTLFGASIEASGGAFAAAAASVGFRSMAAHGPEDGGGDGGGWGMEQRLVESVLHSLEERMAFGRFSP